MTEIITDLRRLTLDEKRRVESPEAMCLSYSDAWRNWNR